MIEVVVASAFAMGLFGGAHCIVMCGGVVGTLCSGAPADLRERPLSQLRLGLGYNAGRIASYALFGAIAGGFGALLERVDAVHGMQIGLRLASGLLMLGVGLYLAGVWRKYALVERLGAPVWRLVEPLARRVLPVRSTGGALLLGALWGWMPCGLVYAALAVAVSAGTPAKGALVMAAFGLGTLPTLLALGTLAGLLAKLARRAWVRRGAGLAIAAFGIFYVVSASAQAGFAPLGKPPAHECCTGKH